MENYAVYHTEKGNVSSGGIGKHIDREPGAEHTYQHADPGRLNLNQNILVNEHCQKPLHEAISDRIKEGYNARNKKGELKEIRKDAVRYQTHILTGSHEQMKKIEEDPHTRKAWINKNLEFIKNEYGEKNIVRFSVHRDEKTMHIHAVTVPLTQDGRLSAKEMMGNKTELQKKQDRYAEQMKGFGLERGIRSTGIKHENAREYYARIEQAQNSIDKSDFKAQKNAFGIYKSESVEEIQNALHSSKIALKSQELDIERLKKEKNEIAERKKYAERIAQKNIKELQKTKLQNDINVRSLVFSEAKAARIRETLKGEAWKRITADIQNSKEAIKTNRADEIIRHRMHELNPQENVWTTLNKNFGDTAEKEIFNLVEKKNKEIELKANQYSKFDEMRKQREEKREQNQERKRGFRR